MYWTSLGLLNRCPQFSNFTLQNREKSSVLKGLTQDSIKSYFYGNDCFEPKIAVKSYLNLLKTVFGKPGQVLSLLGLLYLLRVHVNIISSSQAWLIIISDVNCQYCPKWCELTRNNLCDPAELIVLIWPT